MCAVTASSSKFAQALVPALRQSAPTTAWGYKCCGSLSCWRRLEKFHSVNIWVTHMRLILHMPLPRVGNVQGVDWSSQVMPPTTNTAPGTAALPAPTPTNRPTKPKPSPKTYWAGVSDPASSMGAPFSLPAEQQGDRPTLGALLAPGLVAGLEQHNSYRARHGVSALVWDMDLAAGAGKWAGKCPDGHSGEVGVGENMAWGYGSLAAAVDAWYSEVRVGAPVALVEKGGPGTWRGELCL
jgi:hypothetical protein